MTGPRGSRFIDAPDEPEWFASRLRLCDFLCGWRQCWSPDNCRDRNARDAPFEQSAERFVMDKTVRKAIPNPVGGDERKPTDEADHDGGQPAADEANIGSGQ